GEALTSLTNDELRAKTTEVQDYINQELKGIDDQIAALHQKINDNPDLDLDQKEAIFGEIDQLERDRNKDLEKVLNKVLPKTFAIVRETARRFKDNEYLEVTAQPYDIEFASSHRSEE